MTARCGTCWRADEAPGEFTVKVGTVFESSHVPLNVWLQAVHLMTSSKKGISSHQMMRLLDVTYKTAWFMTQRIRWKVAGPLGGEGHTIEADETWIGGKAYNRAFGPVPQKAPVFALVQRDGSARSFHIPNVTASNLAPIIAWHVDEDSRFMTDESPVYAHPGRWNASHQTVNHSEKEYVRGDAFTNSVECYFSILKKGIYGCYFHVSEAHLHRYLAEFDFRYSYRIRTGYDDMARFERALAGIVGKRLTYRNSGGARSTWLNS
jgi:hypothetical protein